MAHPGKSIRPTASNMLALVVLGTCAIVVACGGSTSDGIGQVQTKDGGIQASGGRGSGGGATGGVGGRATGGQGGAGNVPNGGTAGSSGNAGSTGTGGETGRVPQKHRATAVECDHTRPSFDAGAPRGDAAVGPPVECRSHAECTDGDNGRCVGNGHDGWRCTYDACFSDADCPAFDGGPGGGRPGVCACENGFRSDNNSCLYGGDCRTDADCGGGGYCSPTLGMCGPYGTVVGYYCHGAADECIDDADCADAGAMAYCAYSTLKGHWACSTSVCVG